MLLRGWVGQAWPKLCIRPSERGGGGGGGRESWSQSCVLLVAGCPVEGGMWHQDLALHQQNLRWLPSWACTRLKW